MFDRQLRQLWGFPEARIVALGFPLSFLWEALQSPFYVDTFVDPWLEVVYNRLHCSAGDLFILLIAFWIVALLWGRSWMSRPDLAPFVSFLIIGLAYAAFSEYRNVQVLQSWAYSDWMPSIWGIGLLPLFQWIVVPTAVVGMVRKTSRR